MRVKELIDILNALEVDKVIEIVSVGPENNITTTISEIEIEDESDRYKILVGG